MCVCEGICQFTVMCCRLWWCDWCWCW